MTPLSSVPTQITGHAQAAHTIIIAHILFSSLRKLRHPNFSIPSPLIGLSLSRLRIVKFCTLQIVHGMKESITYVVTRDAGREAWSMFCKEKGRHFLLLWILFQLCSIYHWLGLESLVTWSRSLLVVVPIVLGVDGPDHGLVVHDQHQGAEGDIEHVYHHLGKESPHSQT